MSFLDRLQESLLTLWEYIPALFGAAVVLTAGYFVARLAQRAMHRLLRRVHINEALQKGGVAPPLDQYGVPLTAFVNKFLNMRFEPAGLTDDADIRMAQSVMDYIFRRLALDFLSFEERSAMGIYSADERQRQLETGSYVPTEIEAAAETGMADVEVESLAQSAPTAEAVAKPAAPEAVAAAAVPVEVHSSAELLEQITGMASDSPMCMTCGVKMRPAGSCYVCEGCGSTSGCS